MGGVCPDDEEWAVERASRERTLKKVDGRGCCSGAMSASKCVVRIT